MRAVTTRAAVLLSFGLAVAGCGGGGGGGPSTVSVPLTATFVDAGGNHCLAIAPDGAVLAWGSNGTGQLGDDTTTTRLSPGPVVGLGAGSDVVAVRAGVQFSLALKSDGTVLAWGGNTGSLGDGTTIQRLTPVQTSGLGPGSGVIAIANGTAHSLALKSDGTVLSWGANPNGQLGDGGNTQRNSPVQVMGLGPGSGVIAIAASGTVSAALKSDGTMLAWGNNSFGQLGDGTTTQRTAPVQVTGLGPGSGVVAISTGAHSMALKSDGTVLAWGANANGQVGDGTTTNRSVPVQVTGLGAGSGVVAIAGGGNGAHALALKSDGTVLAWGANAAGQLGDGTTTNRLTPVAVPGLGDVAAIDIGANHSVARKTDGTALAWGSNGNGQLGDGTFQGSRTIVETVGLGAGSDVTALTGGFTHSLALKSDGTVLAFGANGNGQLGDGTTDNAFVPVPVSGLGPGSGVTAIAGGAGGAGGHSLAIKSDGTVLAWGLNVNGQLGDGTMAQKTTPVQVSGLGPGSGVVAVAAGGNNFSLALKSDGTVLAWGFNVNGQLGDGTMMARTTPVQVSGLGPGSGVVAIAAGNHGLALKSDGTVLAWGGNVFGQLGDGTTVQKTAPVQVSGLGPGSGVVAIAAAGQYSLALKSDGTVLAWGSNSSGQLGDGTTTSSLTPIPATALGTTVVTAIETDRASGSTGPSTFVLTSGGAVLGFGSNATGQLGDGTFETRVTPIQIGDLGPGSGVTALAAGSGFLLARRSNGAVAAVGGDTFGQLGDGPNSTKNQTPSPVLVVIAR